MITMLKIFLGLRGTWFWACRKMMEGQSVYRLRDSGIVYFTYDKGRRRINAHIWWETSKDGHEWGVSMEDIFATDFRLTHERMDFPEIHRQTQMKCDSNSLSAAQIKKHLKPIKPSFPRDRINKYNS
jgi:hypothetical protein